MSIFDKMTSKISPENKRKIENAFDKTVSESLKVSKKLTAGVKKAMEVASDKLETWENNQEEKIKKKKEVEVDSDSYGDNEDDEEPEQTTTDFSSKTSCDGKCENCTCILNDEEFSEGEFDQEGDENQKNEKEILNNLSALENCLEEMKEKACEFAEKASEWLENNPKVEKAKKKVSDATVKAREKVSDVALAACESVYDTLEKFVDKQKQVENSNKSEESKEDTSKKDSKQKSFAIFLNSGNDDLEEVIAIAKKFEEEGKNEVSIISAEGSLIYPEPELNERYCNGCKELILKESSNTPGYDFTVFEDAKLSAYCKCYKNKIMDNINPEELDKIKRLRQCGGLVLVFKGKKN